jgi:hypothetical protein
MKGEKWWKRRKVRKKKNSKKNEQKVPRIAWDHVDYRE